MCRSRRPAGNADAAQVTRVAADHEADARARCLAQIARSGAGPDPEARQCADAELIRIMICLADQTTCAAQLDMKVSLLTVAAIVFIIRTSHTCNRMRLQPGFISAQ